MSRNVWMLLCCLTASIAFLSTTKWGFFGHRRINRMAVFTLDVEMMPFFRKHIEYLTEHAVDPDKRRYATRHEAVRHYIDIDHWGTYPFPNVPRNWTDALMAYSEWKLIYQNGDTVSLHPTWRDSSDLVTLSDSVRTIEVGKNRYRQWFFDRVLPQYYEETWVIDRIHANSLLQMDTTGIREITLVDHFSEYGILPYYLQTMQRKLTNAFRGEDVSAILRLCADMGHYIGDAHVPLHTTENYNGQLTNQIGIHAFWESRLPELFADEEFDFLVGKAEYIDDPKQYYWDIVLSSHLLVDSVLQLEQQLRDEFPADQQFCFDQRLDLTVRTQCREFAAAYRTALNGMVERRMRQAIRAVGSSWYTAWVDAGQPNLRRLLQTAPPELVSGREREELEAAFRKGEAKGRGHGGN